MLRNLYWNAKEKKIQIERRVNLLDAQIDMLGNAEAEVAVVGEVLLPQLVLTDLEAALEDLLGLGAPNTTRAE